MLGHQTSLTLRWIWGIQAEGIPPYSQGWIRTKGVDPVEVRSGGQRSRTTTSALLGLPCGGRERMIRSTSTAVSGVNGGASRLSGVTLTVPLPARRVARARLTTARLWWA